MAATRIDLAPMEWYIRVTLYLCLAIWPPVGLALALSTRPRVTVLGVAVALVGAGVLALSIAVCHAGLDRMREATIAGRDVRLRPVTRLGWGWLVSIGVLVALIVAWAASFGVFPGLVLGWLLLSQAAAVIPMLRWRPLLAVVGVLLLLWLGLSLRQERQLTLWVVLLLSGLVCGALYLATAWLTAWMLRVLWELDAARRVAGQLAVAEERLRITRDLHDVFGRTLATISVKSTLAGEYVRRGRGDAAAAELDEIRRIADEAGRETRAVVRGERQVDLDAELRGARAVLDAAGVRCDLRIDPRPLPPGAAEPLAWVIREAVTNILRHSRATRATIVLDADPPRLTVGNDAPLEGTSGTGTGLVSMAERLAAAGGRLSHERTATGFTLVASLEGRP